MKYKLIEFLDLFIVIMVQYNVLVLGMYELPVPINDMLANILIGLILKNKFPRVVFLQRLKFRISFF